jgi:Ca2+-binding RTX toxin-like protein
VSFSLADTAHAKGSIEQLTLTGAAAINGTGNGLANTITGNAAANVLNGGAGADVMRGLGGNDTYVVDNVADTVDESAPGSGGVDTVLSLISFSLVNSMGVFGNLENLTLIGSAAISGTGNGLANVITGNTAANVLDGGVGNDTLTGGLGNDTLKGGLGNDVLIGGVGIDSLAGGAGNDFFVFNAPLSAANRDTITDFNHIADTFRLENAVMTKLGAVGALAAAFFFNGAAAHDANDHIIYNHATGGLFYDSNGNAAGGVTLLATLTNKPVLAANDFAVI